MKRTKLLLHITILFFGLLIFVNLKTERAEAAVDLVSNAKSAVLIELNTGEILFDKNMNEKRSPASMTKIMSIYLILDALDKGVIKWTDTITVSEHAASYGGSQVYLEAGEQMSVTDLFKSMVIASANDATVALAEQVAGSEELFVQKMNDVAKSLGLNNTKFKDPTGLTDFAEGHYTTAYDMAMMARHLLSTHKEKTIEFTSTYEAYIREGSDKKFWLVNTNKLIKHVPGIDGLKTGWTSESGYNLTATMEKDNMRLISVVMGAETSTKRNADTVKLLNFGFAQFEAVEYRPDKYEVTEYKNILLTPQKVKIVTNKPIYFVVKKGENLEGITEKFEYTIDKDHITTGEEIGKLELIKNGKVVYTVPLTIAEDCHRANYIQILGRLFRVTFFG
ncbi:MAG: D-alanyl-D-alanine carboxypeptidase [Haloplasmataceae bacterium]|jgi:D-alanyl-D-alanine carboxypeptidase (penicillin-binding protein 5/6)|nr:D-alanyl-D-alanine carboxypeptidase [Haloplasmataceae bacterium]